MEAIIFVGIPGSGKSTFYQQHFFDSHLRISLDLLNTRNKEQQLIDYALSVHQCVVIDNTNPNAAARQLYIPQFQAKKYKLIAYYFEPNYARACVWNAQRLGKKKIPEVGIRSVLKNIERPTYEEGFDEIFIINLNSKNEFVIQKQP